MAMAWIDYKKATDMIPHSWIVDSLKMLEVFEVIEFISEAMKNWKVELTVREQTLSEASSREMCFRHYYL